MLIGVPLTDLAVDATDLDEKSPGQSIGYRAKIEKMLEAELSHRVVNAALHMIVHYGGLGQSLLLTAAVLDVGVPENSPDAQCNSLDAEERDALVRHHVGVQLFVACYPQSWSQHSQT